MGTATFSPDIALQPYGPTGADVQNAAERAYLSLIDQGHSPADVHRLKVCFDAADFMVGSLTGQGYGATHEVHIGEGTGQHSYVSVELPGGEDLIGDATWQQFLPVSRMSPDLPRVLIGTRSEVITRARQYGVGENVLRLWSKNDPVMSPDLLRKRDQAAESAADRAAGEGNWEKFMALND